jgi:hypothetical protein
MPLGVESSSLVDRFSVGIAVLARRTGVLFGQDERWVYAILVANVVYQVLVLIYGTTNERLRIVLFIELNDGRYPSL